MTDKKPGVLTAKQASNVAVVVLERSPRTGVHGWTYYTTSQRGTKWDHRTYKTRDQAIKAARAAGFRKVRVR